MNNTDVRMQEILAELQQVATTFYRMEINAAVSQIDQVIKWFEEYIGLVQLHRTLNVEEVQVFNQLLELMTNCMQNHDYILLADLIHYELCASLRRLTVEAQA